MKYSCPFLSDCMSYLHNYFLEWLHIDLIQIGTWDTWNGLDIKDIVWPGQSHVPPQGVPEKFHMKISFLEEPPFIIMSKPDPISGKCSMNHGVPCWMKSG